MMKFSKKNFFLVAERMVEFAYSCAFMTMIVGLQILQELQEELEREKDGSKKEEKK